MPIMLGTNNGGRPIGLDPKALTTHATIVGMTGSGKTGVVLGLAEELVRNRIPVVILDIKGDMSNIFLQTDEGLLGSMKPRIITPGADHGESVNITSGLANPNRVSEAVTALLDLVNVPSDPIKSKYHSFLSAILETRHKKHQSCSLLDLVIAIQEPPFDKIGVMELEEVIGKAARKSLASKLNNVLVAKTFEHWRSGIALDMKELTDTQGKVCTPVIVYSIAHLANDDEREFAINLLVEEMVSFMRMSDGSDHLKTVFMVDECYGLMPPRGSGPIKSALLTLLKQGRAAGLGVVLATQNPMDLDYKGMANCGTWVVGRLQTVNDRKRLVEGITAAVPGLQKGVLEEKIGGLRQRHFLLARGGRMVPFWSRNVSCELRGPMGAEDIRALAPKPTGLTGFKNKVINLFK
jgi:hypothetical protein